MAPKQERVTRIQTCAKNGSGTRGLLQQSLSWESINAFGIQSTGYRGLGLAQSSNRYQLILDIETFCCFSFIQISRPFCFPECFIFLSIYLLISYFLSIFFTLLYFSVTILCKCCLQLLSSSSFCGTLEFSRQKRKTNFTTNFINVRDVTASLESLSEFSYLIETCKLRLFEVDEVRILGCRGW